jgi:hypothetical protein
MSRKIFSSSDVQLKQQIIHYKSEIVMYQKKIIEYQNEIDKFKQQQILLKENIRNQGIVDLVTHEEEISKNQVELEKEKENYHLLQEEYEKLKLEYDQLKSYSDHLHSDNDKLSSQIDRLKSDFESIKSKNDNLMSNYSKLEDQFANYKEEKQKLSQNKSVEAHFSYSVILPDIEQGEKDILVIGNYIIQNTGNVPLTNPIICIRINPVGFGRLSGKFGPKSIDFDDKIVDEAMGKEWGYVHDDWKDKVRKGGEYWLKPLSKDRIEPGETLTFSTFNLSLNQPKDKNSIIVEGYSYFNEEPNGVPSLNQIVMNY